MFKTLIPAAASVALVAFAAQTQSLAPEADGMSWHLSQEGAMAKLAYGAENSDQLALMVTCSPGDTTAVVYGDVRPVSPRLIHASSGPEMLDPLSGGDAYETRIALNDSTLRSLASRGSMRVSDGEQQFDLRADGAERRAISGFLSYCSSVRV